MSGVDAAAWAQAYLSAAAILVSGVLAVFVPWNERRLGRKREAAARLSVETSRSDAGGLRIKIAYTPEFRSHSVGAMVYVIYPPDAYVWQGEAAGRDTAGDPSDRVVPGKLNTRTAYNAVSLLPSPYGVNDGSLTGILFVEHDDERPGPQKALIEIYILRHGNYLYYKRRMRVSQNDAHYYKDGAPVAVIVDNDD